jgi:tetratricopeptide (TPR) repeat protein
VAAASFAIYAATAARYPWWGDSAEFVSLSRTLGIAHPPGYPLYTLLCSLASHLPLGSPFLRISLLSAAFASLASGIGALTVWALTGLPDPAGRPAAGARLRVAASVVAGAALAFSSTFWSQATVPEVYTLSALFVVTIVFLAVVRLLGPVRAGQDERGLPAFLQGDRPVLLIGFLLGLAVSHHLTAGLVVPGVVFALYHRRDLRPSPRTALAALGLAALGLTVYAYLPIRAAHDPALMWARVDSAPVFLGHVTGAQYARHLFASPAVAVARKLTDLARSLPREITWLALALSGVGFWSLWRRARAAAVTLGAEAILVLVHAMSYRIIDIESYYIPIYAMLALAAGPGLVELVGWVRSATARSARPAIAVTLLLALGIPVVQLYVNWSDRDIREYRGAARYLDRMLRVIEPGGIVIALNDRTVFLLQYAQFVEGRRTDFSLVDFCSRAPHLEKWYPSIRLPTDAELAAEDEAGRVVSDEPPTREHTVVAKYMRLLVSLNVGSSPMYADPGVAARRMPEQSFPRGLLAEIRPETVRPIPEWAVRENSEMWSAFVNSLWAPSDRRRETRVRYAKTLADQGRLLLARGDVDAAVGVLEAAAGLAPDVHHVRHNLGAAYDRTGRIEEAMSEYRRSIALDPGAAMSYRNVYVILRDRGELKEARRHLETAWRLEREEVGDLLDLAVLHEQMAEPDRAEALYLKAQRFDPESREVEVAYADFLSRAERHDEALAFYQRAATHAPESAQLLRGLGMSYWALGRPSEAREAVRRAIELDPADATAYYDLAAMLVHEGRAGEAVTYLDQALRVDPRLWTARALKAGILSDQGRIEEARTLFEQAFRDGAGGARFWRTWLNVERSAGDSAAVRAVRARIMEETRGGG